VFSEDLEFVVRTGKLTTYLKHFLELLKLLLPIDTQSLEGMNSILQALAKRAPRMLLPLLNARMSIKKNAVPSVSECANLDANVSAMLNDESFTRSRFAPVPIPCAPDGSVDLPLPMPATYDSAAAKAASVACQIARNHAVGPTYAYMMRVPGGEDGVAVFLLTRRLRLYTHCVLGFLEAVGDTWRFRRAIPFAFQSCVDMVKDKQSSPVITIHVVRNWGRLFS
jgi:hypothetical protein